MNDHEEKLSTPSEEMDSATRREFMKVAGIGALGLMYTHPLIETLHHGKEDPSQGSPVGGAGSDSRSDSKESESNESESDESESNESES